MEIGADLRCGRVDERQRVVEATGILRRATAALATGAPGWTAGTTGHAGARAGAVDLVRMAAVLALAAMVVDARHALGTLCSLALIDRTGVPDGGHHGTGATTPGGPIGRAAMPGHVVVLELDVRHALGVGLARTGAVGGD